MQNKSRFSTTLITLLLVMLIGCFATWLKFLYTPLVIDEQGIKYTVREGSSIRSVIDDLAAKGVIKHPRLFRMYVRMKSLTHELKAGGYLFPKGTTPSSMLQQIVTGSGIVYQTFTIVPGWNFKELQNALLRNVYLRHTIQNLSDQEIMAKLGHPELQPEGEFFPDTYYFTQGSEDIFILKRSFKAMQDKLNLAWRWRASDLPFKTPYEALIGASIIEKETFIVEELPKIAGVMVNRLRKGMRLQFDPTVIYAAGDHYDGKIHKADLISKNPYNTYVHKGLTPTPISMPSKAAITAILHPAEHEYYYFVAQSNGSSLFTRELSEHYKAVAIARKTRCFFNTALARYYYLKLFSQVNN